ncbi:peptidoglycan recognition family protein [Actinomadura rugatobispora]|uniref:Peptidoglycan recognition family protein n=1 Tax=Actinomadura rugatobispora TaxID=1994 RepID=A0ABW0ZNZ8_9ACTN
MAGILGFGLLDLLLVDKAFAWDTPPLRVHTRAQWKAVPPRRRAQVLSRAPDRIVVHHTATPNSKDYSVAHAYQLSRQIQGFHMNTRRWDDAGQQLTISRGGHVMEGRNGSLAAIRAGRHLVGAQALHHNSHTIGIENEGTYSQAAVPARLWSSLVETCAWLCTEYRLDPFRAIVGHRDLVATDCPGDVFYARLPELRGDVARLLDLDETSDESDEEFDSEKVSAQPKVKAKPKKAPPKAKVKPKTKPKAKPKTKPKEPSSGIPLLEDGTLELPDLPMLP